MTEQIHDAEFDEVEEPKELVISPTESQVDSFMPVLSMQDAHNRYRNMKRFISELMISGKDYGEIPGTGKRTLLKPGAEKLTTFMGLRKTFVEQKTIENWDEDSPFFFYRVKCRLWKGEQLIAEASGSANSREKSFRWRWVDEHLVPNHLDKGDLETRENIVGEWGWAYDKRETTGKYGKPESYWQQFDKAIEDGTIIRTNKEQPWGNRDMSVYLQAKSSLYRIPNEEIYSQVNTILKMAEKRALVAATLIGCNASEYFTQDIEDGVVEGVSMQTTTVEKEEPESQEAPDEMGSPLEIEAAISWAKEQVEAGSFPPNEYTPFALKLGFDSKAAGLIMTTEAGRDFNKAVTILIQKYKDING